MGEITAVALMGTDIERIVQSLQMLHETWASLLDVAIATWLLERQLGLACLAPIVVVVGTNEPALTLGNSADACITQSLSAPL